MIFDHQNHLKLVLGFPAIEAPNYSNMNGSTELEKNTLITPLTSPLEKMGHEVKLVELNSGLHGILICPDKITSGIDPRREGSVLGD